MKPESYFFSRKPNGRRPNFLRVLTYHRIANLNDQSALDPRLVSSTPEKFCHQMQYLTSRFHVVSMEEVLHAIVKQRYLPEKAVLITFDDAYFDFLEHAWPILKRMMIPVTIFVPTSFPDHPDRAFWWDRLHDAFVNTRHDALDETPVGALPLDTVENRRRSLRILLDYFKTRPHSETITLTNDICGKLECGWRNQKSIMSWDELRRLAKDGVTLGAHTRTHPILTQLPLEQVRQEIVGSQQDLREKIGGTLPVFSYPDGAFNNAVIKILREEGFRLAFTTKDGRNDLNASDVFQLRRNNIGKRSSMPVFRLRMSRFARYVELWRRRMK